MTKQVAIYARVSTGEQTPDNQLRELRAVAARMDWHIGAEYIDHGTSSAKGRDRRPGYDRLYDAIVRREIDLVMAWSVDRLGRSLQQLVALLPCCPICRPGASICTCTNKASTPRPPPARPCSRCAACLPSSNGQ